MMCVLSMNVCVCACIMHVLYAWFAQLEIFCRGAWRPNSQGASPKLQTQELMGCLILDLE